MRTVWESKVDISIPATKGSISILLIFQLILGPSHCEIAVAFLHGGMLDPTKKKDNTPQIKKSNQNENNSEYEMRLPS